MFTGLVETTGKLVTRQRRGPGYVLVIETSTFARDGDAGSLELGESIAVNGACLTVTRFDDGGFEADVSQETVSKTTLGRVAMGGEVNLERSLTLGTRLGGHLVSGHVDGVGKLVATEPVGEALRCSFEAPTELAPYLAAKGSVTLDGVSLTVNAVGSGGRFEVMLIPHTVSVTNLKDLKPGREVNVEVDLLARYVVRYLSLQSGDGASASSLAAALKRAGFLE